MRMTPACLWRPGWRERVGRERVGREEGTEGGDEERDGEREKKVEKVKGRKTSYKWNGLRRKEKKKIRVCGNGWRKL